MAVQQWHPTERWRAHHQWLSVASAQRHRTTDGRFVPHAIMDQGCSCALSAIRSSHNRLLLAVSTAFR